MQVIKLLSRVRLIELVILMTTLAAASTHADTLCLKNKTTANKKTGAVNLAGALKVVGSGQNCPSGYTSIVDTNAFKGDRGEEGSFGATGAQGARGEKGDTGATGEQGLRGDTGATGATGQSGVTGATGAQGLIGPTGVTGATGEPGSSTASGMFSGASVIHLTFITPPAQVFFHPTGFIQMPSSSYHQYNTPLLIPSDCMARNLIFRFLSPVEPVNIPEEFMPPYFKAELVRGESEVLLSCSFDNWPTQTECGDTSSAQVYRGDLISLRTTALATAALPATDYSFKFAWECR